MRREAFMQAGVVLGYRSLQWWQRTLVVAVVFGALVICAGLYLLWAAYTNSSARHPSDACHDDNTWADIPTRDQRVLLLGTEPAT